MPQKLIANLTTTEPTVLPWLRKLIPPRTFLPTKNRKLLPAKFNTRMVATLLAFDFQNFIIPSTIP